MAPYNRCGVPLDGLDGGHRRVLNVVAVPLTRQATTQVGRDRQWLGEPPVTSTMSGRT